MVLCKAPTLTFNSLDFSFQYFSIEKGKAFTKEGLLFFCVQNLLHNVPDSISYYIPPILTQKLKFYYKEKLISSLDFPLKRSSIELKEYSLFLVRLIKLIVPKILNQRPHGIFIS
jgi:hypothetical protein